MSGTTFHHNYPVGGSRVFQKKKKLCLQGSVITTLLSEKGEQATLVPFLCASSSFIIRNKKTPVTKIRASKPKKSLDVGKKNSYRNHPYSNFNLIVILKNCIDKAVFIKLFKRQQLHYLLL